MRIAGIDASSNKTGIAIFQDGKYIEHTLIDLHKMRDASERIPKMMLAICDYVDKHRIDKIVMEESMMTNNILTVKKIILH
jgi:Holliday junction resolvasome RuvABC endonuclease subunit